VRVSIGVTDAGQVTGSLPALQSRTGFAHARKAQTVGQKLGYQTAPMNASTFSDRKLRQADLLVVIAIEDDVSRETSCKGVSSAGRG